MWRRAAAALDVTGSRATAFSTVFYHLLVWAAAVSPRRRAGDRRVQVNGPEEGGRGCRAESNHPRRKDPTRDVGPQGSILFLPGQRSFGPNGDSVVSDPFKVAP